MTTPPGWDPSEPLLPDQTADDRDDGWGEVWRSQEGDDLERFRWERPPHHGD